MSQKLMIVLNYDSIPTYKLRKLLQFYYSDWSRICQIRVMIEWPIEGNLTRGTQVQR